MTTQPNTPPLSEARLQEIRAAHEQYPTSLSRELLDHIAYLQQRNGELARVVAALRDAYIAARTPQVERQYPDKSKWQAGAQAEWDANRIIQQAAEGAGGGEK